MSQFVENGFNKIEFEFEGMGAILVEPKVANEGRNWLLKTEYFGAFPSFEIEMLNRGWHLAFIKNSTRWCVNDENLDRKKRFADYLVKTYNLSPMCIPVGMSCGGKYAVRFAAKYPECVSALYLDAPVMNLLSCPADLGDAKSNLMEEFTYATGMNLSELISFREHPIDKMHLLLENKIPVMLVYGDSDEIVPYHENGALLEKYYKENGGTIVAIGKRGCGHHPHGLEDNTPLIEFAQKYCTREIV